MAREVKCKVCGEIFDRDKVEYEPVGGRRYVHKKCFDQYQKQLQEEENEKEYKQLIHEKMKDVCGNTYLKTKIDKQIKSFIESGISEREIYNTLIYWYDVKKSSPVEAKGGIGIVPYIHTEATKYMKNEYKRKNRYNNLEKETVEKEIEARDKARNITMTVPQVISPKRKHYFNLE